MTSDFVSFMEQLRKVTTIRIAAASMRMRMRMRKWKSPILLWEESDEWNGQPSVASSILDLCTSVIRLLTWLTSERNALCYFASCGPTKWPVRIPHLTSQPKNKPVFGSNAFCSEFDC